MTDEVDVNKLSDEDFDAQFEEMMSTPVEEEESTEVEPESEEEVQIEEEVEEPDEEEEEAEEDTDESDPETEEESEDTESTNEDESEEAEENVVEPYQFDKIPMDEVLPMDIAVNGTKVKATMNELMTGFKQGMNYTQKMQELAPMRKSLNIMKENSLSETDLNLLVEAKQGNKQALAKLIGDANVDSMELEPEEAKDYKPNNYGTEPESFDMEQVKSEINSDVDNLPKVQNALNTMPQEFYDEIGSNAGNLRALHADVASGAYEQVMPEMMKQSALTGKTPSIEMYKEAAQTLASRQPQVRKEAPKVVDPVVEDARVEKRRAASSGTKRKSAPKKSVVDFNDLDDMDFEKEFQKMTGRAISEYK